MPRALLLGHGPALQHGPHRPEDVLKVDADEEGVGGAMTQQPDWVDRTF